MSSYIGPVLGGLSILRNSLLAVVELELKRVYEEEEWWERGVAPRFDKQRQMQLQKIFEARRTNVLVPFQGDEKELLDLSDLYKIIEGEWAKVFKGCWSKSPLSWLKEVLDVRNPLAHPTSQGIDRDMARRLLQNCRYVLSDVDPDATEKVRQIELQIDRPALDDRLKPWYAVATPHEDIREGRLAESVFAADIWAVVQETAPEVYLDPEEFYRKTFMASGLKSVLKRVASGLQPHGESGDRIISLQTAFGGGKTPHSRRLWHLAEHADVLRQSPDGASLREVLGHRLPNESCNVAVFTNQTCDATQGRTTPEGIHTNTLWGELAVQLGGKELYEKVRANDEARRVPQGLFVDILRQASPCLILIDELADYCVGAAAVPVGETTLADQTISFIQQLTEAVQQVPGAVVVATLPASKYEVTQSEKGQEIFTTLEKRFQRLGADIKPVADDEIYDVVRARLFESITPPELSDYPQHVARMYQEMYSSHTGEVPTEVAKRDYREQIARAYPFHPLLIDALYTRWGSHPDFQRTRGVLRLLASIVGDLWQRRNSSTQTQHLIQPSHLRWSIDALQAELTRLWGITYQSVAAADVISDSSNSGVFDAERGGDYLREGIGRGLASAILLGSFGGQGHRAGFSTKELKLACSRQGVNWGYLDGAISELENRCFYLHSAIAGSLGKRYWFGTKPTLNKLVVQYRHQSAEEGFTEEILEDLRESTKKQPAREETWRVLIDPEPDLPEQKSLALLVLPPSAVWDDNGGDNTAVRAHVMEISSQCGGKDRLYRNTLIFLAGTSRGLSRLRKAYRERTALEGVRADYWEQLDEEQRRGLKERLEKAANTTKEALGPTHTVALRVRGNSVETYILPDAQRTFSQHLAYLWQMLVEEEEWILRRVGSVTLEKTGLVPKEGGIRLKDAVDAFLRFTDKPMIASKRAVTDGLVQACADGLIGIGRGASQSKLQKRYCNETIPLDPTEEGIWIIPPFAPEQEPEITPSDGDSEEETAVEPTPGKNEPGASPKRNVRRIAIRGAVSIENYTELFRCFVSPAARMNLKDLHLGIDFELKPSPDQAIDANSDSLKAMREAARQLGLDFEIEE